MAVLLACGAPSTYMESTTQMPMGPGRFFVTVDVNEHTPKATALQYLHQAAYSLCYGAGFDSYTFADSAEDTTQHGGAVAIGNGVYSKSTTETDLGALVVCNTPRTRATTAAPGAGQ